MQRIMTKIKAWIESNSLYLETESHFSVIRNTESIYEEEEEENILFTYPFMFVYLARPDLYRCFSSQIAIWYRYARGTLLWMAQYIRHIYFRLFCVYDESHFCYNFIY